MIAFDPDMPASEFFLEVCTIEDGVMRWKSNNWVPHAAMLTTARAVGISIDIAKCEEARKADRL